MLLIFLFSTRPTNFQKAVGRILMSEYVDLTQTFISLYTLCVQHLHMWMAHKYCQALLLTPSVDRLICWIYHQASVTILMETNFQKAFAERCFSLIDEYAPGFSTSVVGYDMLTPPDLEREFGLTGKLFPIVYTTVCIPCILDPFDVLLNCTY